MRAAWRGRRGDRATRALIALSIALSGLAATSCKSKREPPPTLVDAGTPRLVFPGTAEGARGVANEFAKAGAHPLSIFRTLRPDPADYDAVYLPGVADKVRSSMDPIWLQGQFTLDPPLQNNGVIIHGATTEELRAGTGDARECPTSYRRFAKHMRPGVTIYCFRFVQPGMPPGKLHDGLIYVNEHWALFPKAPTFYQWGLAEAGLLDDDDD